MSEYLVLQQADGVYRQVAHPGYLDENGNLAAHNLLADRGYYLATDTPPTFDARYQVATRDPSDQWTFDHTAKTCTVTYTVTQKPNAFADYQLQAHRQIDGIVDTKLRQGATVTVNGATHTIQTRNVRDNTNMLSLYSKATAKEARGDATPGVLRTQEDVNLELTPSEMITTLEAVFDTQEGIYQQGWEAKASVDSITEGTDIVAALDAVDAAVNAFQTS